MMPFCCILASTCGLHHSLGAALNPQQADFSCVIDQLSFIHNRPFFHLTKRQAGRNCWVGFSA
jgi:hypothetical protein